MCRYLRHREARPEKSQAAGNELVAASARRSGESSSDSLLQGHRVLRACILGGLWDSVATYSWA